MLRTLGYGRPEIEGLKRLTVREVAGLSDAGTIGPYLRWILRAGLDWLKMQQESRPPLAFWWDDRGNLCVSLNPDLGKAFLREVACTLKGIAEE